jgi:pentalenolactone synthase
MTTSETAVRRITTPAGDSAWLVTGYTTVRTLLSDPRLGRSHPHPERAARYSEAAIFGQPMGSPETERSDHALMRSLLTPAFSARRMATLRPRVQELVDSLLDEMSRNTPPVDFHALVSLPLPVQVICELLGVPYADRKDFRRWSDDAADMLDGARSRAGLGHLQAYISELLERKRRTPTEDVLSDLGAAQAYAPGAFSNEGAAQLAAGLLFAGHETTVAAIDKGVILLLTNPAEREVLMRDSTAVPRAVEEILRLPLPVPAAERSAAPSGLPRYANADIELDGTTIAAGDLVLLDLQDANLDPAIFENPAAFEVLRADDPHLTFGYGAHYCIGAPLARIELQAIFSTLFRRFPTLRLAVPNEDLRLRSQLLTGGLSELPMVW